MSIDLDVLQDLHEAVSKHDEGEAWVAIYDQNAGTSGRWSIGPDYEMGHRAELDGWCKDEAHLLAAARNALPALIAEVRRWRTATHGPRPACPECGVGGDVGGTEPNPIPF